MFETKTSQFNQFVSKYYNKLSNYVYGIIKDDTDTQDIVQESLLKAWTHFEHFRGDSQLHTWVFNIARNEALGLLRHRNKWNKLDIFDLPSGLFSSPAAEVTPTYQQGEEYFSEAITKLPKRQLEVFKLRYFEQLPYEQIAQQTGTSVGAMKASYSLATDKIKAWVQHREAQALLLA